MKYLTIIFSLLIIPFTNANSASLWNLPLEVNDQNTTVAFEVDTTWHIVYGKITNVSGFVKLENPSDPMSIISEIIFPVKNFSTGWDKRDQSLHDHMKLEKYPNAILKTYKVKGSCTPEAVDNGVCEEKLIGTLTICDVTKEIEIDIKIEKTTSEYDVKGTYSFKWAEYNIDDPSMVVAKVDPIVKVNYSIKIPILNK